MAPLKLGTKVVFWKNPTATGQARKLFAMQHLLGTMPIAKDAAPTPCAPSLRTLLQPEATSPDGGETWTRALGNSYASYAWACHRHSSVMLGLAVRAHSVSPPASRFSPTRQSTHTSMASAACRSYTPAEDEQLIQPPRPRFAMFGLVLFITVLAAPICDLYSEGWTTPLESQLRRESSFEATARHLEKIPSEVTCTSILHQAAACREGWICHYGLTFKLKLYLSVNVRTARKNYQGQGWQNSG